MDGQAVGIAAVVVLFYPEKATLRRLLDRLNEVCAVFLINNGPEDAALADEILMEYANASWIQLDRNLGVAAALNIGLERSIEIGAQWTWTFDQDSEPSLTAYQVLSRAVIEAQASSNVFAICPLLFDDQSKEVLPVLTSKKSKIVTSFPAEDLEIQGAVTSGMMVRNDCWRVLGGARESLFIDHVDTDLCIRAQAAGYKLITLVDAQIGHSLGSTHKTILHPRGWVRRRSAFRTYHMVRNALLLQGADYVSHPWKIYFRRLVWRNIFSAILYGPDRSHQVKAIVDAFRRARRMTL